MVILDPSEGSGPTPIYATPGLAPGDARGGDRTLTDERETPLGVSPRVDHSGLAVAPFLPADESRAAPGLASLLDG